MRHYKVGDRVRFRTHSLKTGEAQEFVGTVVTRKKYGYYGVARFGESQFCDSVKEKDILGRG